MIKSDFLRRIKSTFSICALLFLCGLCRAQPNTSIAQGELRLDGNINTYNAASGQLVLNAATFTVASGKSSAINPVKEKSILLNAQTHLVDTNGKDIEKSALKPGVHIAVIGTDGGSGKPLNARLILMLDAAQTNTPKANSAANGSGHLQAGEYLLNGQIKGVFSAETIVIDVSKRTDAQGKVEELGRPVEQKLHLDASTKIISAEDEKKTLTVGDIALGQRVAAVGKYGGEDDPFKARVLTVWKEETQNFQKVGVITVSPITGKYLDQGDAALHAGAYPEALQYYTQASQVAGGLGDTGGNALAQSYLGIVYENLNQPQKALAAFTSSINLSTGIGNYSASSVTMSNLGNFYLRQRDAQNALKSYDTALGWTETNNFAGRDKLRADILHEKAVAQNDLKQTDKAIDTMHQAVALSQQLNDIDGQGSGYLLLAFWQLGNNPTVAEDNARQSAALISQLKDPADQAQSWTQLYLFYRLAKDDKNAPSAYEQAKLLLTNLKDQDGLKKLQQLKEGLDKRDAAKQTPKQ
jgi:tetratricopeptide (TPR) repeat protein